jgi:2-succinyl-6-hydroxy-2,4-cyclohexadiene-1-carboxylate synthase
MGARVALGLLDRFPHLFARAILIGVNPGLESEEARQDRLGWEARWIDVLEQDGLAVFEYQWKAQPLFKSQFSIPPRSQDAQRSARLSHTARGLVHALHVLGLGSMPNYWPRLAGIKTPLTFVYGERDDKFSELARRAQLLCPQMQNFSIPGVGHNPLIEAPDLLADLLASS